MANIHKTVSAEVAQTPETRRNLLKELQNSFENRTLVTFFTSFNYPVDITDEDCNMLQSILQAIDCSSGLVLMISSPGGDGIAAERIVNVCRAFSGTGDYWVIVPGKAKSAATIICMGGSKIIMSQASELGPVDPQIIKNEDGVQKVFSAHNLVSGYDLLFQRVSSSQGPIEPYIQQLARYDDREINTFRSSIELSKQIAIKILNSGMMAGIDNDAEIMKKIDVFLTPAAGTIAHGRPIFSDEAKDCGLNVEKIGIESDKWKLIYELYLRTDRFVNSQACKAIESVEDSFYVAIN